MFPLVHTLIPFQRAQYKHLLPCCPPFHMKCPSHPLFLEASLVRNLPKETGSEVSCPSLGVEGGRHVFLSPLYLFCRLLGLTIDPQSTHAGEAQCSRWAASWLSNSSLPAPPKASDRRATLVRAAGGFLGEEAITYLKKALYKNAPLGTRSLQRMCYGCCYLFIPPPTSQKDLKLLTIKTEPGLCTESGNREKSEERLYGSSVTPANGLWAPKGGRAACAER